MNDDILARLARLKEGTGAPSVAAAPTPTAPPPSSSSSISAEGGGFSAAAAAVDMDRLIDQLPTPPTNLSDKELAIRLSRLKKQSAADATGGGGKKDENPDRFVNPFKAASSGPSQPFVNPFKTPSTGPSQPFVNPFKEQPPPQQQTTEIDINNNINKTNPSSSSSSLPLSDEAAAIRSNVARMLTGVDAEVDALMLEVAAEQARNRQNQQSSGKIASINDLLNMEEGNDDEEVNEIIKQTATLAAYRRAHPEIADILDKDDNSSSEEEVDEKKKKKKELEKLKRKTEAIHKKREELKKKSDRRSKPEESSGGGGGWFSKLVGGKKQSKKTKKKKGSSSESSSSNSSSDISDSD